MAINVYLYEPYSDLEPDKILIYSTDDPSSYDFAPGILKDEVNKAGSFEFDIYPNHPEYKHIKTFSVYIGVEDTAQTDNESVLFYGRILSFTINMYGAKHAICEGLLANLLDCPAINLHHNGDYNGLMFRITRDSSYSLFADAIWAYIVLLKRYDVTNFHVDNALNVSSDEPMKYENSATQSCGEFIMSLVDTFGGILELEYTTLKNKVTACINWRTDPITDSTRFPLNNQTFKFGDNIISSEFDSSDSDKIGSFFAYSTYTDSEGEEQYRFRWYRDQDRNYVIPELMDSDGNFVPHDAAYIYPIKTIQLEGTTNGNFIKRWEIYSRLHGKRHTDDVTITGIDEYFIGKTSRRIHIMDRVHIVIPYADYDETKYCLSYELDIANPANSRFKFGDYKPITSQKAYYISTRISSKNK